jgi:hypothetical protein
MNLEVFNVWTVGFWAAMAAAVVWLWRVGSSRTAKWSLVGAVLVTVGSAIWGNLEVRSAISDGNPDIRADAQNVQCIQCRETENRDGYALRARTLNGNYSFSLARDLPYAVRYTSGEVRLDDQLLPSGCHSGTMPTTAIMQFKGARDVRLEVGEQAKC